VKRDPIVIVVVAMVISLLLVFGVAKARHRPDLPDGGNTLKSQMAPDFALTSLDGKTTIRLSDYRGKAVGHLVRALQDRDALVCRTAK
jgi:hypothetical protein